MRVKVASVGLGRTEVVFGVGGVEGVATTFFWGGGGTMEKYSTDYVCKEFKISGL